MNKAALESEKAADPRRWWVLAIMCGSLVLIVGSVSALNVAIPPIQQALDATGSDLQWIVDSYALVFAGLLLPAGALGDRYGRKGALQAGLVIFGVVSLAAVFVTTPGELIATRALMGVGAALVMPATLSIITVVFPRRERGKAIAIWAAFAGAGGAIGTLSSGLLLEVFWWGSVFFVNIPFVVVVMLAVAAIVPTSRDDAHVPLDPVGSVVSIVGLVALVFAIIEGPEAGWTAPVTIGAFAVAIVALVAFVRWEARIADPMLDPAYFRNRFFSLGSLTITLVFVGIFGLFFLLTQYFQFVQGVSPLSTGVRLLPVALAMMLVAPIGPQFVERYGARRVIVFGIAIAAVGFAIVGLLEPATPYVWVAVALLLIGAGMALLMPPATTAIVSSLPPGKAGVGSAVNDTTREVGGSIGIALLGSLIAIGYRGGVEDAVSGLPAEARDLARDSIGGLLQVAAEATPDVSAALIEAGGAAFSKGLQLAMLTAAGVLAVTAVIIYAYFPRRNQLDDEEPEPWVNSTPAEQKP